MLRKQIMLHMWVKINKAMFLSTIPNGQEFKFTIFITAHINVFNQSNLHQWENLRYWNGPQATQFDMILSEVQNYTVIRPDTKLWLRRSKQLEHHLGVPDANF